MDYKWAYKHHRWATYFFFICSLWFCSSDWIVLLEDSFHLLIMQFPLKQTLELRGRESSDLMVERSSSSPSKQKKVHDLHSVLINWVTVIFTHLYTLSLSSTPSYITRFYPKKSYTTRGTWVQDLNPSSSWS